MTFNVVGCELECPECGVYGPHRFDGEETTCLACAVPRDVEPELIASVLDMKFCDWCRETLPASHACRPEEPVCESRTQLDRCGVCPPCIAVARAQTASPVVAMADCRWCNALMPVGHDCPAGAVGCENNPPDGPTCGRCQPCCRAQKQGLAALDAEFKQDPYGSPSDIDWGA